MIVPLPSIVVQGGGVYKDDLSLIIGHINLGMRMEIGFLTCQAARYKNNPTIRPGLPKAKMRQKIATTMAITHKIPVLIRKMHDFHIASRFVFLGRGFFVSS
eukprot:TRINITY_DN3811_c0_g1_i4.p1 TRINITY_DN3811_c0_g1~~TRINITY_DN3811_c0_g1_i4.p1  ORF type:complete len:102 (-),score=1.97 TRINITY_DN3811_c0_g1_i4:235-540(-)